MKNGKLNETIEGSALWSITTLFLLLNNVTFEEHISVLEMSTKGDTSDEFTKP